MATCAQSRVVEAPPARVWDLVGGFGSLPDWLPFITDSVPADGGRVRHLTTRDGDTIVERLVDFDGREMSYDYTIEQAPFPVSGYLASLRVHPVPGREDVAEVVWSGWFRPTPESSDQELVDLFSGIFRDGLDALAETLAPTPRGDPS